MLDIYKQKSNYPTKSEKLPPQQHNKTSRILLGIAGD